MRRGVLFRIASRLLAFTAASLFVPLVFSAIDGESIGWCYAVPMVLAGLLAAAFARAPEARKFAGDSMRRREGFLSVTVAWVVFVFFTALAFHLSGHLGSFANAFFEAMSAYTTTGATVIADLDGVPRSILFTRAFGHWIGGMGIIVLGVAILPELAVGGLQVFSAESSGIEADKLTPRIRATARRLWGLYVGLTALEVVLLLLGGLTLFEAVIHSFSTVATGGFSSRDASIGAFGSLYVETVIVLFMFLAGISFALQFRAILRGQPGRLLRSPEVRLYTAITLTAVFLVTLNLILTGTYESPLDAIRYGGFQVVSILTTTGFGTADSDQWPAFSKVILVTLMLIGGCAGSTAGGSKVIRLYIIIKHALAQLRRLVRPRAVLVLTVGARDIPQQTTEGVLGFYLLYFAALVTGSLAMTALGMDLVSGPTAAISALNSIGPGFGTVGAAQTFAHVPDLGKYVLSFGMLLGRLEIYTVLVLFTPFFWRRG